ARADVERTRHGVAEPCGAAPGRGYRLDHGLDVVDLVAVEGRRSRRVVAGAVDAHLAHAALRRGGDDVAVVALALSHEGGEERHRAAEGAGDALREARCVSYLALEAAGGAMRDTHARVEQAQVVVDLGGRARRRHGRAARELLLEGDGR